jgi:hypothetical protein
MTTSDSPDRAVTGCLSRFGARVGIVAAFSVAAQLSVFAWSDSAHREARLFGDETEYWKLSEGLMFSQFRPFGYPLIVNVLRRIGDSTAPLFVFQSVLALLGPLAVLILLERPLSSRPGAALAASMLSALSLTALTLSKRVLADSLFGVLGALALALLLSNPERNRRRDWLAGALAALSLLLKPIFLLWFPLALGVQIINRTVLRSMVRSSLRLLLLPALAWASGMLMVHQRCGVARYSLIGDLTLQRYWLQATRCLVDTGGEWSDSCIENRRARLDVGALYLCPTSASAVVKLRREALAQLAAHPGAAASALARALWRNLPRPFHAQEIDAIAPAFRGRVMSEAKVATFLVWLAAALGLAVFWHSDRSLALSMLMVFALFGIATSVSFWEGARLLYPVEPLMFAAFGAGLSVITDLGHIRRRGPT